MTNAVNRLSIKPDDILTDYMKLYSIKDIEVLSLAHGDMLSASIAAASILAKVERDHYLIELDKTYPLYNLKNNKGYGTKDHLEALKKYGPTDIHRMSYKPVRESKIVQLQLDL